MQVMENAELDTILNVLSYTTVNACSPISCGKVISRNINEIITDGVPQPRFGEKR